MGDAKSNITRRGGGGRGGKDAEWMGRAGGPSQAWALEAVLSRPNSVLYLQNP